MKIVIKEKSVYGNIMLYPVNDTAACFASLLGKKTFTASDLDLIVAGLGYELEIIKLA